MVCFFGFSDERVMFVLSIGYLIFVGLLVFVEVFGIYLSVVIVVRCVEFV